MFFPSKMASQIFKVCQHQTETQKTNINFIKTKLIQEIAHTDNN